MLRIPRQVWLKIGLKLDRVRPLFRTFGESKFRDFKSSLGPNNQHEVRFGLKFRFRPNLRPRLVVLNLENFDLTCLLVVVMILFAALLSTSCS